MAKFKGVDIVKKIDKMLDKGLAKFLFNTQSKLSAASPVDTGRLASSWVLGKGMPNRESEPERKEKGSVVVTRQYNEGEITMDSDWFVSNNLPYAERAAYDPGYVGRVGGGQGAWFSQVVNNLNRDADRIFQRELKKVK